MLIIQDHPTNHPPIPKATTSMKMIPWPHIFDSKRRRRNSPTARSGNEMARVKRTRRPGRRKRGEGKRKGIGSGRLGKARKRSLDLR
jgi:hypothetical protein